MDEFYGAKPSGGVGKKALTILLVLAMVAVIAFSSIGIYKLIVEEKRQNESETSGTAIGTEQQSGEKETGETTVKVSGYDFDIVPSQVAAKVIPSVVCIQNYQQTQSQYPFAQTLSKDEQLTLAAEGSGIVYTEDGYIITNAHVVANSSLLKVVLDKR